MQKNASIVFVLLFLFALMWVATNRFAPGTQELVASSDVVVRSGAPTINDDLDFNFLRGYLWIDVTGGAVYINEDNSDGAAIWTDITAAGSTINTEEQDALVTANAGVLDFQAGFDLTNSPAGETNISLDYTENPVELGGSEINGTLTAGNGGTGQTAATNDGVLIGNGTGFTTRVIPDCDDIQDALGYDITTDAFNCSNQFGTSIDSAEITDSTIAEVDLNAVDAAADEECLTFESTVGDFEWQACGAGGGDPVDIEESDVGVTTDADVIDFQAGFDVTNSPAGEANISLDYTEDPVELGGSEINGTLTAGNGGTGQTAATNDGVLIGNGTGFTMRILSDCDTTGDALNYDTATDAWSCINQFGATIDSTEITDDTILEVDLKAVNAAADEECLTFESTVGDFEWQECQPFGASIDTGEITDGTINEVDLNAVDAAADEECLTFESTVGDFEWQACGAGSSESAEQSWSELGYAEVPQSAQWFEGCIASCDYNAQAFGFGQMHFVPVMVGADTSVDGIGVRVTTSTTGGTARIGMYASSGTGGLPDGAPLIDAGTVDCSTTGSQTFTFSVTTLTAGELYWLAIAVGCTGGNLSIWGIEEGSTMAIHDTTNDRDNIGLNNLYVAITYSAVTIPTLSSPTYLRSNQSPPRVRLEIQ